MSTEVENIARALTEHERDLILGNGTWGAWVTAVYPMLVNRGLMQKRMSNSGLVIELTDFGQQVADYLSTENKYFTKVPEPEVAHNLRSWSQFFQAIKNGSKKHDLRDDADRNFKVGDYLRLQEFDQFTGTYTGDEVIVRVTYITGRDTPCAFSSAVLDRNYVILGLELVN